MRLFFQKALSLVSLVLALCLPLVAFAKVGDRLSFTRAELDAMRNELLRAKAKLSLPGEPSPQELRLDLLRGRRWTSVCSQGARMHEELQDLARGRVEIWVGPPGKDNQGFLSLEDGVFSLPLRPNPELSRRRLWRAIDKRYRGALVERSAKLSALSELHDPSGYTLARSPAPTPSAWPSALPWPPELGSASQRSALLSAILELSKQVRRYPELEGGQVHWSAQSLIQVAMNSDGLSLIEPSLSWNLVVKLKTRAPDGTPLDHAFAIHGLGSLPDASALQEQAGHRLQKAAQALVRLRSAQSATEGYDGPVLLSPAAAATLLASSVALHALGEPAPLSNYGVIEDLVGRWQSRVHQQVMARGIDLLDDPRGVKHARGLWPLDPAKSFSFARLSKDAEGVQSTPLELVRDGILESLFMTRVANRYQKGSRGRARNNPAMQRIGGPTHLRLRASKKLQASQQELHKELLRRASEDGYDYAYIIDSFRPAHLAGAPPRDSAQQIQDSRNTTMPLPFEIWRIDRSGKRVAVRSLMVAPMSLRVLRRIRRVGRDDQTWAYRIPLGVSGGWAAALDPQDLLDLAHDVATSTPSLLVDGLELWVERGDQERKPVLDYPLTGTTSNKSR